jgi:hypothetical protein
MKTRAEFSSGSRRGQMGRGSTEPTGEYTFFHAKGNENHELGTGCCFFVFVFFFT